MKIAKREPPKWKPPAGKKKRQEMPASAFLLPSERKFPVKVYQNGEWVYSEKGLMAAYKRAKQHGYTAVARRAFRLLNQIRKKKGKETLEWKD